MNKMELIAAVAEKSGLTKADTAKAVSAVFEVVTETLSGKEDVRLTGFGTFYTAERKATTGRNPKTGAPIQIAASTLPKFKAGKGLKEAVN
ncbi:MAG: HU family DNA-binding protein [Proteobacteria bacterium]|nr:HU family DNA-binding protein [Pseudomonadota bacterium]